MVSNAILLKLSYPAVNKELQISPTFTSCKIKHDLHIHYQSIIIIQWCNVHNSELGPSAYRVLHRVILMLL